MRFFGRLLSILTLAPVASCSEGIATRSEDTASVAPPRYKAVEWLNQPRWGTVVAITSATVTLDSPAEPKRGPQYRAGLNRYRFSHTLATGGRPTHAPAYGDDGLETQPYFEPDQYKVSDVRIGDEVIIHWSRADRVDYCDAISIQRRPEGLVPPAPDEHRFPPGQRYHDRMNAHWKAEAEKAAGPKK